MDLSKIPPSRPPGEAPIEPIQYASPATAMRPAGVDAALSIGVGIILIFMMPRMFQWASSRLFGTNFNEFMLNGSVVPYPQTREFWMDLGPAMFAVMLILDGIILLTTHRRAWLMIALALTLVTALYNLGYLVATFNSMGFAIWSAVATLFGGYLAWTHWKMLRPYGFAQ